MDAPSEKILASVMPEVAARARRMDLALRPKGIYIRVVQGLRTIAYQNQLWQQGRDAHGNIIDPKRIVTKARGGESYHNYGLAIDCVPNVNGLDMHYLPDWNSQHPAWQAMEAEGKALGFEVGAYWRTFQDFPHFQLNGPWPVNKPPAWIRYLITNDNLQPVWNRVQAFLNGAQHGN